MHPEISPSKKKEINYFSHDYFYNKGEKWYINQFKIKKGHKLLMEASTTYFHLMNIKKTPERIFKFNKKIKLIVIIRDPVKRAYSAWNMFKQLKENNFQHIIKEHIEKTNKDFRKSFINFFKIKKYPSFKECVQKELNTINKKNKNVIFPDFIRLGIYYNLFKEYLKLFSENNILIIENRDLKEKKIETLNKITKFLSLKKYKWDINSLRDIHSRKYRSMIDKETDKILKEFYDPYNKKLYETIGKRFDW